MAKQSVDFNEFKKHFPAQISKSLVKFVTETVLKDSRYLFIKTVAGVQFAYCTHCQRQNAVTKKRLKHKQSEPAICPNCKSKCGVRSAGISRKYMRDRGVFVWYEKSRINPKAITARVIAVYRDYSGDFKDVETMYSCNHMYLFEPGKGTYFSFDPWEEKWKQRSSVFSAFDRHYNGGIYSIGSWPKFMSASNIKRAVKGTPFQYSTWEKYTKYQNPDYVSDMVNFFDLAARYPCVEYLTKLGFQELVWAKLYKYPTYGAINWRGTTPEKVLRLSREDIQEIRRSGLSFGPHHLKYFQKQRKSGNRIPVEDAYVLSDLDTEYRQAELDELSKIAPKDRILSYLLKQYRRNEDRSILGILIDYRDYLHQCEELGMSLEEERYVFPNDLNRAHQKLTRRIKLKKDKELNRKIMLRSKGLKELTFEHDGLIARPIWSLAELFNEGKALNHCVGAYADRYANGWTNIFAIRKIDDPDKPYFTLEFIENSVRQCRGAKNSDMTKRVKKFVNLFVQEKLQSKKRKRKKTGKRPGIQEAIV